MKEEDKILERYGRKGPWKVPEGYFDSVRIEIESKLPDAPAMPKEVKLSVWQRVKPYVYLAAMFAGIWCMMQVFHNASGMGGLNLDNPPEQIAMAMSDPEMSEFDMIGPSFSDDELIEEVSENYDNIQDFEEDFGYEIEPEYNRIKL